MDLGQASRCRYIYWRIQDFPEVGAPTYNVVKFSQELHEIERIWTPGACRSAPAARDAHGPIFLIFMQPWEKMAKL